MSEDGRIAEQLIDPEFGPGDLPPASEFTIIDHASLWISRVTMFLVAVIVGAITYEVVARYFFRAPTLWANELSLFLGGMSYLFAGLFAMQQRSHIRVTALYDHVSPTVKRVFDAIALVCVLIFSVGVWRRRLRFRLACAVHLGALRHRLEPAYPRRAQAPDPGGRDPGRDPGGQQLMVDLRRLRRG
jgi:tripartite ATP-independent transporter DctQ subunit